MTDYQEGMISIIICFAVFNIALMGIVIYCIIHIFQMQKESKVERLKVKVLIESMTEIFESKYKLYDDENESDIPRRD